MSNPGPASTSTNTFVGGGSPERVGTAATSLVGFWGADPVVQAATVAAVSTSAAVSTLAFGFASSAQFNALIAAVNSISAALKTAGILASS